MRIAAAIVTLALAMAQPGDLASDLDALFTKPPFDTSIWSVRIERVRDGQVLYERNPRTLVMPASNMKIVTMAAAMRITAPSCGTLRASS